MQRTRPAGTAGPTTQPNTEVDVVTRSWSKHASAGASLALALVMVLALGGPAALATTAAPVDGTAITVDDGPGNQVDPHISGTLVTYTSLSGGHSEIRYRDLASDAAGTIPGLGQDLLADVSDGTIVFTRFGPGAVAIYSYETATGELTELDPQEGAHRRNPAIGGGVVAWEDYGLVGEYSVLRSEIVVYDRASETTTPLTDDALFDLAPRVSPDGTLLVWLKCTSVLRLGCEVWQAERGLDGWTSTPAATEGGHLSADSDGAVVVYQATREGDADIYWTPVGGGAEQRLALPGFQRNPSVSGGLISFESNDTADGTFEVFVYDLHAERLSRISDTPGMNPLLNDIALGTDGKARVVWSHGLAGNLNVYGFEFSPPGRAVHDTAFHAPVSAPPDANVLKAGRVLPVRVSVTTNGVADHTGPVAIELTSLAACPEGAADQPVDATAPGNANSGNLFRFEAASGRWAYNLDTKGLSAGGCYRAEILVGGTVDPDSGRATGGNLAGWFLLRLRP